MNVYTCGDIQHHCIVASSMSRASELYTREYGKEPEELKLYSEYVIVDEETDDE